MSEKKRKLRKDGKEDVIEEDDPAGYKKALWITVTKVFADREKKRKMLEERANEEKYGKLIVNWRKTELGSISNQKLKKIEKIEKKWNRKIGNNKEKLR